MATATVNSERLDKASKYTSGSAIVLSIAAAVLVLQLATANRYGYFGDEHLAWGYS